MQRYEGWVVWFSSAKGYGFLGADGISDVFCHYSAIEGDGYKALNTQEPVTFEIETGTSGRLQAVRVRAINRDGSRELPASAVTSREKRDG